MYTTGQYKIGTKMSYSKKKSTNVTLCSDYIADYQIECGVPVSLITHVIRIMLSHTNEYSARKQVIKETGLHTGEREKLSSFSR